jgi:hypothetical protein
MMSDGIARNMYSRLEINKEYLHLVGRHLLLLLHEGQPVLPNTVQHMKTGMFVYNITAV